ncbi:Uncharacterised protein [Halioglobus japonicus]|nr:Uncharacterised protein [Halioglobus japonicus]CAA0113897.1 Uncharacterised protein [Halioglobus japonicus]
MKLDGEQGITAFYRLGEPTNPAKQGALVSNLELGQSYSIYYAYLGNDQLNLSVAGRDFSMDIGAKPTKVTHMVSGMVAIVE